MKKSLIAVSALAVVFLISLPVAADTYGKPLGPAQPVKVSELISPSRMAEPMSLRYTQRLRKIEGLRLY